MVGIVEFSEGLGRSNAWWAGRRAVERSGDRAARGRSGERRSIGRGVRAGDARAAAAAAANEACAYMSDDDARLSPAT